ncbi:MAG: hypothetical protein H6704_26510 [Myxococcales bacterium]|nr:hypothetical protein [Myxococcales bacterium]
MALDRPPLGLSAALAQRLGAADARDAERLALVEDHRACATIRRRRYTWPGCGPRRATGEAPTTDAAPR